ncbi:MAG: helicase C-terminal domain-containing protein [Archaeoglobaceae archaeon]
MSVEKDLFPLIFEVFSRLPPSESEIYEPKKFESYPFEKARIGHNKAIEAILGPEKVVFLTAPTGTGKTVVYLTALIESGLSGFVLLPRNGLQEQVEQYNFYFDGVDLIYLFAKEKHCDNLVLVGAERVPLCNLKVKKGGKYYVQYNGELLSYPPHCYDNCPYLRICELIHRKLKKAECIPLLNTGNFWPFKNDAGFVIVDEVDETLRMIKDAVDELGVCEDEPLAVLEWMEKKEIEKLEKLEEMFESSLSDEEVLRVNRSIEHVKRRLKKIEVFKSFFADKLITYVNKKQKRTYVEVFETDILKVVERLFKYAEKIVLVTATPPPYVRQAQNVTFSIPFPRTAVFYYPVANLSVRNLKKEGRELLEKVVSNVIIPVYNYVTQLTGVGKVPIHCGNLSKHGEAVSEILRNNGFRVVLMEKGKQREAVDVFVKGTYDFLCIVAAEYGYDWVEFPLQIILKVPYLDLYDPRTQAIKRYLGDKFNEWYAWDALSRMIQACGRNVRDPSRFAISLILDSKFEDEYSRFADRIPQWFKERLIWVKPSSSLEQTQSSQ